MIKTSKKLAKKNYKPKKSDHVPVTRAMLFEVRDELKHELSSRFFKVDARFAEMESRFDKVDARFAEMESRFDKVDARFAEMESRFDKVDARFANLDSKLEKILSEVHRIGLLVEEQNARNKFVLDGYTSLSDRLEKIENKDF
ncbi:MAG: hypothetical protein ABL927_03310 [Bdellovibrionales bacterium]